MKLHSPKFFNFLINILLSVSALILLTVLGEILLQILDYDEKKIIGPDWFKKHVTYNSLGYRDHEHSLAKPKDTFRILVLGWCIRCGIVALCILYRILGMHLFRNV